MYEFTAIRGIQASREYYLLLCPMKLIPRIFSFNGPDLPPEMRAQRVLNKGRIPEMKQYLLDNTDDYILSALTASVDEEVIFEATGTERHRRNIGTIRIPMMARIIINDGQHRRVAIQEALEENPALGHDYIGIVLFVDRGLKHSQQMFADLNRYAVRPTKSLGILYDYRSPLAQLTKTIVQEVPLFNGMTEMEKTSISNRSIKLFTLSGIYHATMALLKTTNQKQAVSEEETKITITFWKAITEQIPDWRCAKKKEVSTLELRQKYIHAHGICLQALGCMGADLLEKHPENWKRKIVLLKKIDWSRTNVKQWEGRAMLGGRVNKARQNIILTTNAIKQIVKLPLTESEQQIESQFLMNFNRLD